MTDTLTVTNRSSCLARRRRINRWLRRLNTELDAAHRLTVTRAIDGLVTTASPLERVAVGGGLGPACAADLVFASGVGLRLTQCHRGTLTALEQAGERRGPVITRIRHHGRFWSLDFTTGQKRFTVLTREIVVFDRAAHW